jgi:hypothetical protein
MKRDTPTWKKNSGKNKRLVWKFNFFARHLYARTSSTIKIRISTLSCVCDGSNNPTRCNISISRKAQLFVLNYSILLDVYYCCCIPNKNEV